MSKRIFGRLLTATAALLALSCTPGLSASKADVEAQFEKWVQNDLWPEAQKNGISERAFRASFAGVELNWNLTDLAPPYSDRRVERLHYPPSRSLLLRRRR